MARRQPRASTFRCKNFLTNLEHLEVQTTITSSQRVVHPGNNLARTITIGAMAVAVAVRNLRARGTASSGAHHREEGLQIDPARSLGFRPAVWISGLRVHQWAKNALVLVPLLTSHQFSTTNSLNATLAFAAFSLCASAVYLLNDLVDLEADRAHPTKRFRVVASGQLPSEVAAAAIPFLLLVAAMTALTVSSAFAGMLATYFVLTSAYTFYLKRLVVVDIVVLASLYTMRIVAGAVAISVPLSEWLLLFSIFIFTSLALIKRYAELSINREASLPDAANRDYGFGDMQMVGALAAASGMNAIVIICLYLSSPAVRTLYRTPELLWLLVPLLIHWVSRALMLAHRGKMSHDPIVFAFQDGPSRVTALLMVVTVLAAI
jgi:4-hydroxybenzoate polyprenyltransferase